MLRNLPYDPEKDFEPNSFVALLPNIFAVSGKLPVKTVAEFIQYAKKQPKPILYGSVGIGSAGHLGGAYFSYVTGIKMTHVPYRGMPQLVTSLMTGEIDVSFAVLGPIISSIEAGTIAALAVTADKRLLILPDVPTIAEAGIPDFESSAWVALLAPRGTPRGVIDRLNRELRAALADPHVIRRCIELGALLSPTTPEELGAFISAEISKSRGIVEKTGISLDQQ